MIKISAADVFAYSDDETGAEVYVYAINYNANEKTDLGFTQYSAFAPFDNAFGIAEEAANKASIAEIKIVHKGKVLSSNYGFRFVGNDGMVYLGFAILIPEIILKRSMLTVKP